MLQKPLLRAVIARACQAGEEEEHWHFFQGVEGCLRGEEEVEGHFAGGALRIVFEFEELAAEGGEGCGGGKGHYGFGGRRRIGDRGLREKLEELREKWG